MTQVIEPAHDERQDIASTGVDGRFTMPSEPVQPAVPDVTAATHVVEEILDRVPVTDRVWHHLRQSQPLVARLVAELRAAKDPPARVLVLGPNITLALALLQLGYTLDLWHFRQGHLTDDLVPYVRAVVTPEQLAGAELPLEEGTYDAILLPLILESVPGTVQTLLAGLERALKPDGRLIAATTNASRLDIRLLTLAGHSTAPAYPQFHLSFSWPPLPRLRYWHRDELEPIIRWAGLRVLRAVYVQAQQPYAMTDPLPLGEWLKRIAGRWGQQVVPSTRDALLLHLAPRPGAREVAGATTAGLPRASAILASIRGGAALREALGTLTGQEYPPDRYEIIVLHDGRGAETEAIVRETAATSPVPVRHVVQTAADGPAARNAAVVAASGDVCLHTDDECRAPPLWVRSAVAALDPATAVVTGPVLEQPHSHPYFFVLPGTRPMWRHQGMFPVSNAAYWRAAALAAGGFDARAFGVRDAATPATGWDTELAWRLQRQGWQGTHVKDLFLYRRYRPPRRLGWIQEQWQRACDLPPAIARTPEWGDRLLVAGHFAGPNTLSFDLLVLGLCLALARQERRWLLLTLPWLAWNGTYADVWPPPRWLWTLRVMAALGARHVIWLAGLLRGSIAARRVVL